MFDITRVKYKKNHLLVLPTYRLAQKIQKQQRKTFDQFALKVANATTVKFNEYEAVRRILSRKIFKLLRFSLTTKPYIAVTAKPREIRMGKGKGAYSHSQFVRTIGQTFAKVHWCHKQTFGPLFLAVRGAAKKTSQRLII